MLTCAIAASAYRLAVSGLHSSYRLRSTVRRGKAVRHFRLNRRSLTFSKRWCSGLMWSALLRSRLAPSSSLPLHQQQWRLGFPCASRACSTSAAAAAAAPAPTAPGVDQWSILELQEVEKVLSDVRADDVKVIPGRQDRDWADYIVLATGRSSWHVKNIAQALIYKAKQKQKGARRLILPSVSWSMSSGGKSSAKKEEKEGKWVVVDSGKVVVHALDEEARAYYDLDGLLTTDTLQEDSIQDLGKALVKIRRKNNSKRRTQNGA